MQASPRGPEPEVRASRPVDRLCVVIADDDHDLRTYVRGCLGLLGIRDLRVIEAGDGIEALDHVRRGGVDVVISDVLMPRLDGVALAHAIAQEMGSAACRVLLVSGMGTRSTEIKTWRDEGSPPAVLGKPFNAAQLCGAVARLLESQSHPGAKPEE